jgi:hypothetical protein
MRASIAWVYDDALAPAAAPLAGLFDFALTWF